MVRELISGAGSLGSDRLVEAIEELPVHDGSKLNPTKLGHYIGKHSGRIAGDLMIEPAPKAERRAWRVVRVSPAVPPSPPLEPGPGAALDTA